MFDNQMLTSIVSSWHKIPTTDYEKTLALRLQYALMKWVELSDEFENSSGKPMAKFFYRFCSKRMMEEFSSVLKQLPKIRYKD